MNPTTNSHRPSDPRSRGLIVLAVVLPLAAILWPTRSEDRPVTLVDWPNRTDSPVTPDIGEPLRRLPRSEPILEGWLSNFDREMRRLGVAYLAVERWHLATPVYVIVCELPANRSHIVPRQIQTFSPSFQAAGELALRRVRSSGRKEQRPPVAPKRLGG